MSMASVRGPSPASGDAAGPGPRPPRCPADAASPCGLLARLADGRALLAECLRRRGGMNQISRPLSGSVIVELDERRSALLERQALADASGHMREQSGRGRARVRRGRRRRPGMRGDRGEERLGAAAGEERLRGRLSVSRLFRRSWLSLALAGADSPAGGRGAAMISAKPRAAFLNRLRPRAVRGRSSSATVRGLGGNGDGMAQDQKLHDT